MSEPNIVTITGKNNALNRVNDQYCGGDGGGVAAHPGQLLKTKRLTKAQALQLSDTAIGTLYAGVYQYVQLLSTVTQAAVRGNACFWKTAANYEAGIVSSDGGATVEGRFAGVFINVISAGYFGWIQVEGEASCAFKSSVSDTTDGNAVRVTTTTFTFDSVADATANATYGTSKGVVGTALEAAASSTVSKVLLKGNGRNF
jgi:hypothetical protein